jgi:hypothetical protein
MEHFSEVGDKGNSSFLLCVKSLSHFFFVSTFACQHYFLIAPIRMLHSFTRLTASLMTDHLRRLPHILPLGYNLNPKNDVSANLKRTEEQNPKDSIIRIS